MAVYQQPGANALDVSKQVRATLAEMKKTFPEGLEYSVAMDTTEFTRASISDVVHTFFEALVLVVIVVFVFLQSLRATLIPVLAVPVSIVGTFMGMLALGFSINMLTLFGMVLAIGIVVDDAIVVIENVERNMNVHKLSPKDAAKRAMDEVSGPVIAIVLVLCAVFVPVAFLGGITGQLYKQFAITIAISVVISGLVALTLSPALAALLLKPGHHEKRGFFKWFDNSFERMTRRLYARGQAGHQAVRRGTAAVCGDDRARGRHDAHDTDFVSAARRPGLSARRDHHAGRGEPRSHRRSLAARHRLFHEAAGRGQRDDRRRLQPARQPEQEQRERRSSSASRVSTNATSSPTSRRRTRGRC